MVKYTKSYIRWMALGEIGSYLISVLLAATVYMKVPLPPYAFLRILAALFVFFVTSKIVHWFIHLGYEPEVDGPG